MIFPLVIK